jgi:uncharacterized protein
MELYYIPFQAHYLIYRPLRHMVFVGNGAMVRYIKDRVGGNSVVLESAVEGYLDSIRFWEHDPPMAEPWFPALEHRPTTAVLMMTSACNLRCTYCYAHGGEDPGLWMNTGLARRIIDRACENAHLLNRDTFSLAFHGGGEPTLNWEVLTDAVRYARKKDLPCHVSMASNGLWDEKQHNFIIDHFDGLSLSFDGIRSVQDHQRPQANGHGSFETVMKTINALDQVGFPYGIRLTATPNSWRSLPESIAFICHETHCPIIQVEPCYSAERGKYNDPSAEQANDFSSLFMAAYEIALEQSRTLYYSGARPWTVTHCFCGSPQEALVVTPEGDLVTCFEIHDRRHRFSSQFVIGRATQDLIEIDTARLGRFVHENQRRRSRCRDCFCYWHCGGDCTSRYVAYPEEHRGRCLVNRNITRELLVWQVCSDGNLPLIHDGDQALRRNMEG